jgi:hypothetical protein
VLSQLTGKDETHGSLNLPRGDGRLLVVSSQLGGLSSDTLEDVYETNQSEHGPRRVDAFQKQGGEITYR